MDTFGYEPHDTKFQAAIVAWAKQNNIKIRALLFATSRWCLLVCEPQQQYNWIVFWSPYVHGRLIPYYDNIIRFYDWNSIPTKNRKPLIDMFHLWEASR